MYLEGVYKSRKPRTESKAKVMLQSTSPNRRIYFLPNLSINFPDNQEEKMRMQPIKIVNILAILA